MAKSTHVKIGHKKDSSGDSVSFAEVKHRSDSLPSPDLVAKLKEIDPRFLDIWLKNAEEHPERMERLQIESWKYSYKQYLFGTVLPIYLAFFLSFSSLSIAGYFFYYGNNAAGFSFIVSTVVFSGIAKIIKAIVKK